jgi:hypothetical protein
MGSSGFWHWLPMEITDFVDLCEFWIIIDILLSGNYCGVSIN